MHTQCSHPKKPMALLGIRKISSQKARLLILDPKQWNTFRQLHKTDKLLRHLVLHLHPTSCSTSRRSRTSWRPTRPLTDRSSCESIFSTCARRQWRLCGRRRFAWCHWSAAPAPARRGGFDFLPSFPEQPQVFGHPSFFSIVQLPLKPGMPLLQVFAVRYCPSAANSGLELLKLGDPQAQADLASQRETNPATGRPTNLSTGSCCTLAARPLTSVCLAACKSFREQRGV